MLPTRVKHHLSRFLLNAYDEPPPTDGLPTSSCVMPCSASSGILLLSHGLLSIYSRKPRTTGMPSGAVKVVPSSFYPAGTPIVVPPSCCKKANNACHG